MDDLMNAALTDVTVDPQDIIVGDSAVTGIQSADGEFTEFIMPDGSIVYIDRLGNIIK